MKKVRFSWYLVLLLCVVLVSERNSYIWLIAAAVHEVGHFLMILASAGSISSIAFSGMGAAIGYTPRFRSLRSEIAVYAAGPCAGALLTLIACAVRFDELAKASFALTAINLLPALPLDGGCILSLLLPYGGEGIARAISCAVASAACAAGLFFIARGGNFSLLGLGISIFLYLVSLQYPRKDLL